MKHVGLNVAADPLFTASYTGVNGGLVVLLLMIRVCTAPRMNRIQELCKRSKVPVIEPSDSQECKDFTKKHSE